MSNTYRKGRNDKVYKESLKKKFSRYKCRCTYCLGKGDTADKIAEKELKTEIKLLEIYDYDYEIICDKQGEFCNDYCCTVRDEEVVEKYVINY